MIEVILDASQIEYFEKCERSWWFSYDQDLVPIVRRRSFDDGSYWHAALEYYYSDPRKLGDYAKRMGATMAFMRSVELRKQWGIVDEDLEFHIERFRKYCYRWFGTDEAMEVIAVEKGFSWLLFENEERRYILEGKIDLVARIPGLGFCIVDHKTQSRKYSKYRLNHQCLNYYNYLTSTGHKPDYFVYNYIGLQDSVNADTFRRELVKPDEDILNEWKKEVLHTFDDMYDCRKGQDEHPENTRLAYPKRRSACQSQFGLCAYHKICSIPDDSKWVRTVESAYKKKDVKWRAWS